MGPKKASLPKLTRWIVQFTGAKPRKRPCNSGWRIRALCPRRGRQAV